VMPFDPVDLIDDQCGGLANLRQLIAIEHRSRETASLRELRAAKFEICG